MASATLVPLPLSPRPLRPQFEGHTLGRLSVPPKQVSQCWDSVFVTSVSPGPAWYTVEGHRAPACWMSRPLCSPGDEGEQNKLLPALSFEHSGSFGTPCQQQPPKLYTWGKIWALGSPGKQCLGSGRGRAGGENWLESGLPFAGCVTAGRWCQLSGHHGGSR